MKIFAIDLPIEAEELEFVGRDK